MEIKIIHLIIKDSYEGVQIMFNKVNFAELLEKDLRDNQDLKRYAEVFNAKYELIKELVNIRKNLNLTKEEIAIRGSANISDKTHAK